MRYVVCGMRYVVCGMWYGVCGMGYVVWGMWYEVCGMGYVVWGMGSALQPGNSGLLWLGMAVYLGARNIFSYPTSRVFPTPHLLHDDHDLGEEEARHLI